VLHLFTSPHTSGSEFYLKSKLGGWRSFLELSFTRNIYIKWDNETDNIFLIFLISELAGIIAVMSKSKTTIDVDNFEEQAALIASEVFGLLNQYTNDSGVSKFFLTDEVARACYGLAGGFASVIYTPPLKPKDTKDTTILSFIYALMTYGFNVYLKERSLTTNAAPYKMPTDNKIIRKVQKKLLTHTSKGKLVSTPLSDKIIKILIENIKDKVKLEDMNIRGYKIDTDKFYDYCKLSMYWGYNFARELLNKEP